MFDSFSSRWIFLFVFPELISPSMCLVLISLTQRAVPTFHPLVIRFSITAAFLDLSCIVLAEAEFFPPVLAPEVSSD
jgi:hypothetical protein